MSAFPNEYTARRVADASLRACKVCFKPTTTVLVSLNQADFFYTCAAHLKDASFSEPVKPQAYADLLQKRAELETRITLLTKQCAAAKPYLWSSVMTKVGLGEAEKPAELYESLVGLLAAAKAELGGVNDEINSYTFKTHTLDKHMYQMRLNAHAQGKPRAPRPRAQPAFPSVPLNPL